MKAKVFYVRSAQKLPFMHPLFQLTAPEFQFYMGNVGDGISYTRDHWDLAASFQFATVTTSWQRALTRAVLLASFGL